MALENSSMYKAGVRPSLLLLLPLAAAQVDPARNLLFVRGQVPGPQGSFVYVRDAFRWKWAERQAAQLPFPTFLGEALPEVQVARSDRQDPYRVSVAVDRGFTLCMYAVDVSWRRKVVCLTRIRGCVAVQRCVRASRNNAAAMQIGNMQAVG